MNTAGGVNRLHIDIETYSSVDITKSGLHKYVQSDDFDILLFAYSLNEDPVQIVDLASGEQLPEDIRNRLSDPTCIKYAYNAAFEWTCLSKKYGVLPIDQWHCVMLHGCYCGFPPGLDAVGKALGFSEDKKKMAAGKALIKLFCNKHSTKPQQNSLWDMSRVLPEHEPEKWALFKEYCTQDVVTEMEVERRLSAWPVPAFVQREWELDTITNEHGVRIDTELVNGALACWSNVSNALIREAKQITALANPNSPTQLTGWLQAMIGKEIPDLTKATVADLLKEAELPEEARKVLEIRQELAKTSIKKYETMKTAICNDGRVRGLLQFYGARTGRWAGRLVQVQNLPRNYIESLDAARQLTKLLRTDALRLIYGNVPDTLSQLIRTAFIPSEGNVFVVADFSAIEARVISWLAGEQWRLEAFRQGKDIYCESASQMFGVPVEKHGRNSELRQKGKIAELALGYQGGVGALKAMGADKMGLSDAELQDIVTRWREANPRIVELWKSVEEAACTALAFPYNDDIEANTKYTQMCMQPNLKFAYRTDVNGLSMLTISLPSVRKLFYPNPKIEMNKRGFPSLTYDGLNTAHVWGRLETYGGKLTENIVQAVARDCLSVTLARMQLNGFDTVMHIHDEVVLDVPEDKADLDYIIHIMTEPIAWAPDLPLDADGFIGSYYKKE